MPEPHRSTPGPVLRQEREPGRDRGSPGPAGRARLLPCVTFGLGAAVLAGVILAPAPAAVPPAGPAAPVAVTVSLGAPIGHMTCATTWTSC